MNEKIIQQINTLQFYKRLLNELTQLQVLDASETETITKFLVQPFMIYHYNLNFDVEPKNSIERPIEIKNKIHSLGSYLLNSEMLNRDLSIHDEYKTQIYLQLMGVVYIRSALAIGHDFFFEDDLFQNFLHNISLKIVNLFLDKPIISALMTYFCYLLSKKEFKKVNQYFNFDNFSGFKQSIIIRSIIADDVQTISLLIDHDILSIKHQFRRSKKQINGLLDLACSAYAYGIIEFLIQRKSDLLVTAGKEIFINLFSDSAPASAKKQHLLDILFKHLPDVKTLLQIFKLNINTFPSEYILEYSIENLKSFFLDHRKFIVDICSIKDNSIKLRAFLKILSVEGVNISEEILTLLSDYEIDSPYVGLILNEITIDFSVDKVEEYEGDEEEGSNHRSEFENIARFKPTNALAIMQYYNKSKINLNQNSPLLNFLEVIIQTNFDSNQHRPNISYFTFISIKINHIKNVKKLLKLINVQSIVVCKITDHAILRIALDLPSLVNKINSCSEFEEPYVKFEVTQISRWNKDSEAFGKIEAFLKRTIPDFLAAKKVKKFTKLPGSLNYISQKNIARLTKNFQEIIADECNEHKKAALIELFNYLCIIDYSVMHASNNAESILESKKILSCNQLSKSLLKDVGQTSILDERFGNTDYVFGVFSPVAKPYPEDLKFFYGNTVFSFSFEELLKRNCSVWVKSTDWYYFAENREIELKFGNTTVVITHRNNPSNLSENSKEVSFKTNDIVTYVMNRKMIDESFTGRDIKLGLALLIMEQFDCLDEAFQMQMLGPFFNNTNDASNKAEREKVACELSNLLPACEASVANQIPIDEEILINLYTGRKNNSSYKNLNLIHQAFAKNEKYEYLGNLIIIHKNLIDMLHPITKISLLNKAILDQRYDILELLIKMGAELDLPSCIAKDSAQFTPLMLAILMSDQRAYSLLMNFNANYNFEIYPCAPDVYSPRDRWEMCVTPLSLSYLLPTNKFSTTLQKTYSLQIPQKTLAVFIPLIERDGQKLVLLSRKGYKSNNELKAYGDWVFPAVILPNENNESELLYELSYLLGTDFFDLNFSELFVFENIFCSLTQYTIRFYTVDLDKVFKHIPKNSEHLCNLTWVDVNQLKDNRYVSFDNIRIHHSNALVLQYICDQLTDINVLVNAWKFDLSSTYLLHKAIIDNDVKTFHGLLQHEVYVNAKITLLDPTTKQWIPGCTPLITVALYAQPENYEKFIEILSNNNADPNILDKKGKNVLDYANNYFKQIYLRIFQYKNKQISMLASQLLSKNFLQNGNVNRKRGFDAVNSDSNSEEDENKCLKKY